METEVHSMSSSISINEKYKSSIRLDSLSDNYQEFVSTLIMHGTLEGTVLTVCNELLGSAQRAFTITGPYGSGKSTLAGLVSGFVGVEREHRRVALKKVESSSPLLAAQINSAFPYKKGWAVVQHVCGLSSPSHAITASIATQVGFFIDTKALVSWSDAECLQCIRQILVEASQKFDGVLLLIDELGKALDFQSNNDGDLYFFQELADIAQQAKFPLIIIGFLHQAFSQYAKGKTALTQQEWAKVQGRYRDLSYNPTVDESLVLIGDSIKVDKKIEKQLTSEFTPLIESVLKDFPNSFTNKKSLLKALPLDPIVSLLLGPISRRRFSQNERSIFGFLASRERYGFRWFIENEWTDDEPALYGTDLLWKYLDANLSHLIVTSPDGKGWLEAQDTIHRAQQKGDELHVLIVTVIALISIFGQSYQLFATQTLVQGYFGNRFSRVDIDKALKDLEVWTLIIFRKRHGAYFIFQGSDLDINALIISEVESIREGVSWAEECMTPSHILASSHYHLKGPMRWATSHFAESENGLDSLNASVNPKSGVPFVGFVLIAENLTKKKLQELSARYENLILSSVKTVERLRTAAIEVVAIKNIFKSEEKLSHDHIAKQELENRLSESKLAVVEELEHLFAESSWFYRDKPLGVEPLSKLCSAAADIVFDKTPTVINELVNRSKPSGSANSATNKLMLIMLNRDREENLGFDGKTFPPEKGIYLSALQSQGWHSKTEFGYGFTSNWTKALIDKHKESFELWQSGYEFIRDQGRTVTVAELYEHWMKPPFGLTAGLCRIYAMALLKSLEGKVAYYDKDSTQSFIFIPELDEVLVEKLHKHPHEVGVRYFEIDSVQTHLVQSIAEAAQMQSGDKSSLLALAKEIVRIVHMLPSWVKKTSGVIFSNDHKGFELSREAKALRNAALRANDPYKLVLEDIPNIFNSSATPDVASSGINKLANKLRDSIDELNSQHFLLLDAFKTIIHRELSADFDEKLVSRSATVAKSAHRPAVKEFAQRLLKYAGNPNDDNFVWVISTAMGVAERNWTDKHISNGLHVIYNLCRQFRREESFNRMSKAESVKTYGLISSAEDGSLFELEGHVASLDDSVDIDEQVGNVAKLLDSISEDTKREILIRALSRYMYPVKSLEDVQDD